ncbi:MAG: Hsp20/alpha crystallin family protein [Rhabdochlamydiaceae bacterium]|nr:Hsp20/alpha crystallin family protein [Rhabdochlamydiaceae bacterium]
MRQDRKALLPFFWDDEEEGGALDHYMDHSDVSLSEDQDHIYIEAAVPGVTPDEIEINYDKGILRIKADKKEETQDKDRKFYRKTNRHFFYQIPVPGRVNEKESPEATCKDGMLKVCFSKLEEPQKKKISVKKG